MANKVKIARSGGSTGHTAVSVPTGASLAYGELGWVNGTNRLYIGRATANPTSSDGSPAPYEITRTASSTKTGMAAFDSGEFNISAFVPADGTGGVVSLKDSGVLNAHLGGSIANSKLSNSTVVIGSTSVALGGTATSFSGLTNLDCTTADHSWAASLGANTLSLGHADGTIAIVGDLTVAGTTTSISSTNLEITDKKIQLGKGSASQANLDGIGIYGDPTAVGATDVSFLVSTSGTRWTSNVPIIADIIGDVTGDVTGNADTADSTPSLTGIPSGTFVGRFDAGTGAHQTKTYAELRGLIISAGSNISINASGVITSSYTNTQLSTADVRGKFSGGTNVTLNASTGVISSTDTNTQLSTADVRGKISATGNSSYNASTGVITSTDTNTQLSLSDSTSSTSTTVAASSKAAKAAYDRTWPNTQLSTADVRGKISASGNTSYNSTTGVITSTDTVGATSAQVTAIGLNTAKTSDINHNVSTNLTYTQSAAALTVNSSDGTNASLPVANTNGWGVMSDDLFDLLAAAVQPGDVIDGGSQTWS